MTSVIAQTSGIAFASTPFLNGALALGPQIPAVRYSLPYETPVALDGIRISLPSSGTFDLAYLPTFAVGDVEVVRGPGDPAQLGGAANGSINIRTADPGGQRRAFPETAIDSRGGSFSDVSCGGTSPGGHFSFATIFSVDGNRGGTPFDQDLRKMLLVDLREAPAANVSYRAVFMGSNLERSYSGSSAVNFGGPIASPLLAGDEFGRFRFLLADARVTQKTFTYTAQAFSDSLDRSVDMPGTTRASDTLSGLRGAVDVAGRTSAGLAFESVYGGATTTNPYDVPLHDAGSRSFRFDAYLSRQMGPQQVDLSGSYGRHTQTTIATVSNTDGAFRAGYSLRLAHNVALRAAYGINSIAPTLDQLAVGYTYRPVATNSFAQPTPVYSDIRDMEIDNGFDAGIEWKLHGDTTTLSADAYHTHVHSPYIAQQLAIPRFGIYTRSGPDVVEEGVELSLVSFKRVGLGYELQADLPRTFVPTVGTSASLFNGNAAIVPGANLNGGNPYTYGDNDIAAMRVPYARAYAEISYKWPRGSRASFGALYTGSNNALGDTAYSAFNANLELSVGSDSKLQLSAENLGNTRAGLAPLLKLGAVLPSYGIVPLQVSGVLPPATIRIMIRRSFGASIYEH